MRTKTQLRIPGPSSGTASPLTPIKGRRQLRGPVPCHSDSEATASSRALSASSVASAALSFPANS